MLIKISSNKHENQVKVAQNSDEDEIDGGNDIFKETVKTNMKTVGSIDGEHPFTIPAKYLPLPQMPETNPASAPAYCSGNRNVYSFERND